MSKPIPVSPKVEKGLVLAARAGKKVGDIYTLNWEEYKVVKLCKLDPDNYCYIQKVKR